MAINNNNKHKSKRTTSFNQKTETLSFGRIQELKEWVIYWNQIDFARIEARINYDPEFRFFYQAFY